MLFAPWLTRSLPALFSRVVLPYSAYVIASSSDVFPAPVCPVIANRSNFEKSTSHFSRNAVKPLSSSLIGRMSGLVVEFLELSQHLRGCGGALLFGHKTRKQIHWLHRSCILSRGRLGRGVAHFLLDV